MYNWYQILTERGVTLTKLSQEIGISRATMYNWMKKRSYPSLKTMDYFTTAFNKFMLTEFSGNELWEKKDES